MIRFEDELVLCTVLLINLGDADAAPRSCAARCDQRRCFDTGLGDTKRFRQRKVARARAVEAQLVKAKRRELVDQGLVSLIAFIV